MGFLDMNDDGKVDGKDLVCALKGPLLSVVRPVINEAMEQVVGNTILDGSDEWAASCGRHCQYDAPAVVKAVPTEARDYIIKTVSEKFEREIAAKAIALAEPVVDFIADKLGASDKAA